MLPNRNLKVECRVWLGITDEWSALELGEALGQSR